jgi:hypothetical protein
VSPPRLPTSPANGLRGSTGPRPPSRVTQGHRCGAGRLGGAGGGCAARAAGRHAGEVHGGPAPHQGAAPPSGPYGRAVRAAREETGGREGPGGAGRGRVRVEGWGDAGRMPRRVGRAPPHPLPPPGDPVRQCSGGPSDRRAGRRGREGEREK